MNLTTINGTTINGAASVAYAFTPDGGFVLDGEGAFNVGYVPTPTDGLIFGGTASYSLVLAPESSGPFTLEGSAPYYTTRYTTLSGGFIIGGGISPTVHSEVPATILSVVPSTLQSTTVEVPVIGSGQVWTRQRFAMTAVFVTAAGVIFDPGVVKLTFTYPKQGGTIGRVVLTYADGDITRDGTGRYSVNFFSRFGGNLIGMWESAAPSEEAVGPFVVKIRERT